MDIPERLSLLRTWFWPAKGGMDFQGWAVRVVPQVLKLREKIDVQADGEPWMHIVSGGLGTTGQTYLVTLGADSPGSIKRRALASLGRLQFEWRDPQNQARGEFVEQGVFTFLRPAFPWLPARFVARWDEVEVARVRQRLTWRGRRWDAEVLGEHPRALLVAQMALLAVVEARRTGS